MLGVGENALARNIPAAERATRRANTYASPGEAIAHLVAISVEARVSLVQVSAPSRIPLTCLTSAVLTAIVTTRPPTYVTSQTFG